MQRNMADLIADDWNDLAMSLYGEQWFDPQGHDGNGRRPLSRRDINRSAAGIGSCGCEPDVGCHFKSGVRTWDRLH